MEKRTKMKFFIAQRVTGEDKDELTEESKRIASILEASKHEVYCTMFVDIKEFEKQTKKAMMEHAFKEIGNSDALLVIVRTEEKSEGMLMEVGYALGKKKKIVLLIKNEVKNTYLRELADKVLEFKDVDDLHNKLKKLKI